MPFSGRGVLGFVVALSAASAAYAIGPGRSGEGGAWFGVAPVRAAEGEGIEASIRGTARGPLPSDTLGPRR